MIPKERLQAALTGQPTDRPLFCPAIYEHKARLLDRSPSDVARDAGLIEAAVLREYERYRPDILTVGIDVYDVEAEAMGSTVVFPDDQAAVPVIAQRLLETPEQLDRLRKVDPERSGRMRLFVDASARLHEKLSDEICVRGSLSGPYSVAAELLGVEPLMMASVMQTDQVDRLLEVCTEVVAAYGRAFLKRGVEVCLFDSQTAPPLMSPQTYGQLVLPHIQRLVGQLKEAGATFVEYVVGGNTTPNIENLFATGCDILLCDFSADIDAYLQRASGTDTLVRWNISPVLVERGGREELAAQVAAVVAKAKQDSRVLVGTGVLSYNVPPERIELLRQMVMCELGVEESR